MNLSPNWPVNIPRLVPLIWLTGTLLAGAQGTVNFTTKSGTTVDAPVYYGFPGFGGQLVVGTGPDAFLGQLYASAPGQHLEPVGPIVPFRSDAGKGYITAGGEVAIPGTSVGGSAVVQLVAWLERQGSTYAEALNKGTGLVGSSATITVNGLGGGATPPALLAGLSGFSIVDIPEPQITRLSLCGILFLAVCSKRNARIRFPCSARPTE